MEFFFLFLENWPIRRSLEYSNVMTTTKNINHMFFYLNFLSFIFMEVFVDNLILLDNIKTRLGGEKIIHKIKALK